MSNYRHIKDLVLRHKTKYILGMLSVLAVDILQLALPKVLGIITDLLKDRALDRKSLLMYCSLVLLLALGIAFFRFFWRYLVMGASRKIETELRNRFYAHLQKLSVNYFNTHKTGDLMAHATNDIQNIRMALGPGITMSTDSAIIPLAAIVMMFITGGPLLTLVSCLPFAALVASVLTFVKLMHSRVRKVQEAFSRLTETARENFSGIRVVKSFVQEESEAVKFRKINEHNREMNIKYIRLMSMLFPAITTISALSFALALWFGGRHVILGHISLGDFVAFTSYLSMLTWPVSALGWITSMFQRGSVSLKRINKILDEEPEIADGSDPYPSFSIKGRIEIRNLSFCYPGSNRPVLKNINVTIERGKTLAIVGKTGSGKTTLVNLLLRLYNVPEGTIFIDGVDICRIPLSTLRRNIGYAPQDSFLFSTTIKQNIDFFRNLSDDEIVEAAKTANVYDNIMDFPDRFETMVGERGITLSGGQKQRISIARALLGNPPVIILDDCLSAVDTQTEEKILEGLKGVISHKTSIIISHRISSLKNADEIIVLEDGEIAERGSHFDLLEQKGLYYNLYQKQMAAEQIDREE